VNWIAAIVVVAVAALLGAFLTGDPTTGPYTSLSKPVWTPPLYAWLLVAATYYIGMIVAFGRLLLRREQRHAIGGLVLMLIILVANELWNVFLFKLGRPDLAFYSLFPFAALVAVAASVSLRADRLVGIILFIYLAWLIFDFAWTYQLASMN
jgi:tryptophan-rich sensory protein